MPSRPKSLGYVHVIDLICESFKQKIFIDMMSIFREICPRVTATEPQRSDQHFVS